jgi:hypothetical protein
MTTIRRRWTFVAAAFVLVVLVSVVLYVTLRADGSDPKATAQPGPPVAASPTSTGPLAYAYTSSSGLVINRTGGAPVKVPGAFYTGSIFWTGTGDFVVAFSLSTTDDRFLTVVDVRTGAFRRVECGCWGAAPAGGDRVAYVNDKTDAPLVLDLAAGTDAQPFDVTLPDGWRVTEAMAGGGDSLLVRTQLIPGGQDTPEYDSPDKLYAVKLGDPTPRKVSENHFIVGSSAVGGAGADGSARFGVTVADDDGRCNSLTYWLWDGSTGTTVNPPMFVQSAPGEQAWMTVSDWWWDGEGALHASLTSQRCTDETDAEVTAPPTLWRLDGDRWTQVDQTVADAVRPLGAGTRLLLRKEGQTNEYDLYVETGGKAELSVRQVYDVAVAPARPQPRAAATSTAPGPSAPVLDGQLLRKAGACKVPCEVAAQWRFEHPAWGPVTLVTTKARGGNVDVSIAVVDATGAVKWSHWGGGWPKLAFAEPTRDGSGNIFLNYDPGRYNGVIVLRPTAAGFDTFGTLQKPGDYSGRFYNAVLVDTDKDGTYEIEHSVNNCEPSCAQATVTRTVYRWNGSDYARSPVH